MEMARPAAFKMRLNRETTVFLPMSFSLQRPRSLSLLFSDERLLRLLCGERDKQRRLIW